MAALQKVLVIGGGIGGLATTIQLRKQGVEVDLVELNPKWDVYGVGIIQPGNAIRALDQLGLADQAIAAGFAMDGDRFSLADGTILADNEHPRAAGPKYPSLNGITRTKLHEILTTAVRESGAGLHIGMTITALEQDADGVDVTFTDGTTGRYDLVIGADGINSMVRSMVFPDAPEPEYTGQVVWRYNLPRPAEVDRLWMFASRSRKAGLVPLAPDLMYVLMIETLGADADMRLGDDAALRLPEDQLADIFRERLSEFGGAIADVRDQITDSSLVVYRPVYRVLVDRPWYRGRVALLGDAAHATSPHVGQGAAMALEDAIVLAEETTAAEPGDLDGALDRWMERRFDRVKTICDISRQIGDWELEGNLEGDFVGLTVQSVITTAAPI
jgi:2-polyprenyl-6-methoxyphenol hydroxylase-like FAD-dependent oxidoreductase